MDVYASSDDLKDRVAPGSSGLDDRLDSAVAIGSRIVDRILGNPVDEEWVTFPITSDLDVIACPPSWREATLAAAARVYKSSDVPFGVVGGLGDYAVRVGVNLDEVRLILYGQTPLLLR